MSVCINVCASMYVILLIRICASHTEPIRDVYVWVCIGVYVWVYICVYVWVYWCMCVYVCNTHSCTHVY